MSADRLKDAAIVAGNRAAGDSMECSTTGTLLAATDAANQSTQHRPRWQSPEISRHSVRQLTAQNPVDGPLGDSSYAPGTGTS
jgi:hypothetical protein